MTTSPEWGDVLLTGQQMKALREAGLPGRVLVRYGYTHPASVWLFNLDDAVYQLPANDPSYLCHVHNSANGTSFKPWYGGDEAPGGADQYGEFLMRNGVSRNMPGFRWRHTGAYDDIIGYHALPKQEEVAADEVPEWANGWTTRAIMARAQVLADEFGVLGGKNLTPLASYIAQHEQPPVDPVKEALAETYGAAAPEFVSAFKDALAKRGLQITEKTK